jgi:hypothetical protein
MSWDDKWADAKFVHAGEGIPPATAEDLLRALAVESSSRGDQRSAVEAWLEQREPNALMRAGLERLELVD